MAYLGVTPKICPKDEFFLEFYEFEQGGSERLSFFLEFLQYLTIYIIRVTLNTLSDNLWFIQFGTPGGQIFLVAGTSSKNSTTGAVHQIGLMLIHVVVSLQFVFENGTFFRTFDSQN